MQTDSNQNLNLSQSKSSTFQKIQSQMDELSLLSNYPSTFDVNVYKDLEDRYAENPPRGGIVFKTPFKLVNAHSTCQQCLYAFEVDTYGRGCTHDCVYCYAKDQLETHGYWNRPIPFPIDISEVWKTFYTVFETDKRSKWRNVMEKRVPIRIGSMSDSFMHMDRKYKVTQEFLKILKYYDYPYIIFTRSDLVANDEYLKLLDRDLCSVQMSISSTNDLMNRLIEPGAPSASKRLKALQKLRNEGFWTTVRINPLFPVYPNGFFTDPTYDHSKTTLKFDYFNFDMIDEIADHGVQSLLAGFVRLSGHALKSISTATNFDLKPFFGTKKFSRSTNYHYDDSEIRYYYQLIKERSNLRGVQFTTCYIGNGETHFWKDQDLWDNKKDCCNVKDRVEKFKSDSRQIAWDDRLKQFNIKGLLPNSRDLLHAELGKPLIVQGPEVKLNMEYLR